MATTTSFGNMLNQKPATEKKPAKKATTAAPKNLAELRKLADKKTKKKGKK